MGASVEAAAVLNLEGYVLNLSMHYIDIVVMSKAINSPADVAGEGYSGIPSIISWSSSRRSNNCSSRSSAYISEIDLIGGTVEQAATS